MRRIVSSAAVAVLLLTCVNSVAAPAPPATQQVEEAKRDLTHGDSKKRLNAFRKLHGPGNTWAPADDALLAALEAAASDPDARVRKQVAIWVGTWWVARKPAQDPKALELACKLAADDDAGVRDAAVYYGLSAMEDKPDAVVAAMVGAAMREPAGESNVRGRVVWGLRGVPPEKVAPHLEPYFAKHEAEPDRALLAYVLFVSATKREPPGAERLDKLGAFAVMFGIRGPLGADAEAARKLLRERLPAGAAEALIVAPRRTTCEGVLLVKTIAGRRAVVEALKSIEGVEPQDDVILATEEIAGRIKAQAAQPALPQPRRPEPPPVLAPGEDVKTALVKGDSQKRLAVLGRNFFPEREEGMLEALEACAADPDARVRAAAARCIGGRWIWNHKPQDTRAIKLCVALAGDDDGAVRYEAVYYGLSTVQDKGDRVIAALVSAALTKPDHSDIRGRVTWGLRDVPPQRLAPFFDEHLKDPDEEKSLLAYETFVEATAQYPPGAERFRSNSTFSVWFGPGKDSPLKDPAAVMKAFRSLVPEAQVAEVLVIPREKYMEGKALVKDLETFHAVVAKLKDDPDFAVEERPQLLTPRELRGLRAALAQAPQGTISTIRSVEPLTYEDVFRDLHAHLGKRYPNFELKNIDWKKVGEELILRAAKVKTDAEFGLLCTQLVARLEDSHAQLLPGTAQVPTFEFPQYDPGFACLIDDRRRAVVYHVDKNSPADQAGVKVGMAVVRVNGTPAEGAMDAWMERQRTYVGYSSNRYLRYDAAKGFCRQMKQGDLVKLEMEDPDGKPHAFELPATLGIRYLPRLPVSIEGINDSGAVEAKDLGDGIGYVYVRRIRADLPEGLDAALRKLGDVKGLIIDVRGNSGGGFDSARAFRNFDPADAAEPDRPRFKGPIALLIDERCISAGEGWSSWFVAKKRAKLFGTHTAGASARKETYTLPNGLYKVTFPVKAYTGFLDRPIERRGLEPDVPVKQSAKDLAAGKDTVLEAAKRYLAKAQAGN